MLFFLWMADWHIAVWFRLYAAGLCSTLTGLPSSGSNGPPSTTPAHPRETSGAPLASAEDLTALSADSLYPGHSPLYPATSSGLPSYLTLSSTGSRLPSDLTLSDVPAPGSASRRPLRAASGGCLRRFSGSVSGRMCRQARGVSAPIEGGGREMS